MKFRNKFIQKTGVRKQNRIIFNKQVLYLNVNNNSSINNKKKIYANSSSRMNVFNNLNKLSINNYYKEKNDKFNNQLIRKYSDNYIN